MPVVTYLKDKQKKIESKYHHVAKQFESKYVLIHQKVTSRFHREINQTEVIHSKINNLIIKSILTNESKMKSNTFIPIFLRISTKKLDNLFSDKIDWTRRRFTGQVIHIIVREGKIIEKVFLTPNGNRISVRRTELGLLFR